MKVKRLRLFKICSVTVVVKVLLVLCIPGYIFTAPKIPNKYILQNWMVRDGLPQNTITGIAQTRDGYLWLGTRSGLVRFNGLDYKLFNSSNTPAFKNDYIFTMLVDSQGYLWAGTYGGGLIKLEDGQFTTIDSRDGLADNVIWSLFEDSRGTIWVGTGGNGISKIDKGKITSILPFDGLGSSYIWTITEDPKGAIWIGTDGDGPIRITDGVIDNNPISDSRLDYILSSFVDSRGDLWFGTPSGLFHYDGRELTTFNHLKNLANSIVWSIIETRDGQLLVGTEGGGVFLYEYASGNFTKFTKSDGLGSDLVTGVFQDLEGNIWVGCKSGGLNRINEGSVSVTTESDGLGGSTVYAVYEDSKGQTWFGTLNGGVSVLSDGNMTTYSIEQGLQSNIVLSITEDPEGHIWVGTDGGGISHIEPEKITTYTVEEGLSNENVWSLTFDSKGTLWVGTDGGGLDRLGPDGFYNFDYTDGIESEFISAIITSRKDGMWIGTRDLGLYYYDGGFTHWDTSDGLVDNVIWSLHEDIEGNLWAGSSSGVNRIGPDGKITSYTKANSGILDNMIYGIIEDETGNLWMSSNQGIFRIEKEEILLYDAGKINAFNILVIGIPDGMLTTECSSGQPSAWRTKNGDLWFPTIYGAVRIDPDSIIINEKPPPVFIEEITINGTAFPAGDKIIANTGNGNITVNFAALSYRDPINNQFRYRLAGFDQNWHESGSLNKAYYTNITPGKYIFEVIGSNNNGIWNNVGDRIEITLIPPFYRTWWFKALIGLAIITAVVSIIQLRLRIVVRRERQLEKLVLEKTESLENSKIKYRSLSMELAESNSQKKLLLDIITHDLLNPLGVISNLAIHCQEEDPENEVINIIKSSSSKMVEVINDARVIAEVSAGDKIEMDDLNLTELIKSVAVEFSSSLNNAGIKLSINLPEKLPVRGNKILSAVFRNYISNAITYASDGKELIIDCENENGILTVNVRDFGTTILPENRLKVFQRGYKAMNKGKGRGLGLSIVKRIAVAHNAVVGVKPNNSRGNIFYISIPVDPRIE